jgi:NADPH-dependent glutamate synthase beta subunit-like oxidoreductase
VSDLGLETDPRWNVKAGVYETSESGVFACGDARIGQVRARSRAARLVRSGRTGRTRRSRPGLAA